MVEAVRHLKVALAREAVLQTVLQTLGALEAMVVQAVLQALGPLKVALEEALLVEAVLQAVLQTMGPLKVAMGATAAANHLTRPPDARADVDRSRLLAASPGPRLRPLAPQLLQAPQAASTPKVAHAWVAPGATGTCSLDNPLGKGYLHICELYTNPFPQYPHCCCYCG